MRLSGESIFLVPFKYIIYHFRQQAEEKEKKRKEQEELKAKKQEEKM